MLYFLAHRLWKNWECTLSPPPPQWNNHPCNHSSKWIRPKSLVIVCTCAKYHSNIWQQILINSNDLMIIDHAGVWRFLMLDSQGPLKNLYSQGQINCRTFVCFLVFSIAKWCTKQKLCGIIEEGSNHDGHMIENFVITLVYILQTLKFTSR